MSEEIVKSDFIRNVIRDDLSSGRVDCPIFRFPPEPNGFLHIGHAKAICLNFGLAKEHNTVAHLRMDDTNPLNEDESYARAIEEDVRWLGFDWGEHHYYASDYFEQLYACAVHLIKAGKAYMESLSPEDIRIYRGTLTTPGKPSPYRERSVRENLDLFERLRAGEFEPGEHCLRAIIDMTSGNMNMRDPVIYRQLNVTHYRTGDAWCIYPMYDFAHALSDAIEGITHSLCTLEFQDHRPLYDWFVESCDMSHRPRQFEFSRLNINHTITSKRKLKQLVESELVSGWDDPRMPTIRGMRRRGYPPTAIRQFCAQIGVSKQDSVIDFGVLEECVRDELNQSAQRRMVVFDPIKVNILNFEDCEQLRLLIPNHPQQHDEGNREVYFESQLYISGSDFSLDPPKKFKRLVDGGYVRLMNAYVIRCESVELDDDGQVKSINARVFPETLGGKKLDNGDKVKGVVQWVGSEAGVKILCEQYDRLFHHENPATADDILSEVNQASLREVHAIGEAALGAATAGDFFQFCREAYYCVDKPTYDNSGELVFNRVVSLRSQW